MAIFFQGHPGHLTEELADRAPYRVNADCGTQKRAYSSCAFNASLRTGMGNQVRERMEVR
jgi:hypothetical protein